MISKPLKNSQVERTSPKDALQASDEIFLGSSRGNRGITGGMGREIGFELSIGERTSARWTLYERCLWVGQVERIQSYVVSIR
jgi:hypothetical protein